MDLYYPKRPDVPTYKNLLKSAELSGVNIIESYNLSRIVGKIEVFLVTLRPGEQTS